MGQASRLLGEAIGPFQAGAVHPCGCASHGTGREVEEPPDAKTDARTGSFQMAREPLLLARLTECHHQDTRPAGANAVHDGVGLAVGEEAVLGANHAEARDALAESLRGAFRHGALPSEQEDRPSPSRGAPQHRGVEVAAVEDGRHAHPLSTRRDADAKAVGQAQVGAGERRYERGITERQVDGVGVHIADEAGRPDIVELFDAPQRSGLVEHVDAHTEDVEFGVGRGGPFRRRQACPPIVAAARKEVMMRARSSRRT